MSMISVLFATTETYLMCVWDRKLKGNFFFLLNSADKPPEENEGHRPDNARCQTYRQPRVCQILQSSIQRRWEDLENIQSEGQRWGYGEIHVQVYFWSLLCDTLKIHSHTHVHLENWDFTYWRSRWRTWWDGFLISSHTGPILPPFTPTHFQDL